MVSHSIWYGFYVLEIGTTVSLEQLRFSENSIDKSILFSIKSKEDTYYFAAVVAAVELEV